MGRNMTDEYPSWRDALFSDDKIANLRCAAKYVLWHGSYIVLAVVGVVLLGLAKVWDFIAPSSDGAARNAVGNTLGHPHTKKAGRYAWGAFVTLYLIVGGGWILYLFAQLLMAHPLLTIGGIIATVVAIAVLLVAVAYGGPIVKRWLSAGADKTVAVASTAGSKAVETPGIRRVYGECPVHMDLEPQWFERLLDE